MLVLSFFFFPFFLYTIDALQTLLWGVYDGIHLGCKRREKENWEFDFLETASSTDQSSEPSLRCKQRGKMPERSWAQKAKNKKVGNFNELPKFQLFSLFFPFLFLGMQVWL